LEQRHRRRPGLRRHRPPVLGGTLVPVDLEDPPTQTLEIVSGRRNAWCWPDTKQEPSLSGYFQFPLVAATREEGQPRGRA
jgi:hypothetical protein